LKIGPEVPGVLRVLKEEEEEEEEAGRLESVTVEEEEQLLHYEKVEAVV
jgi:hypothetical protein